MSSASLVAVHCTPFPGFRSDFPSYQIARSCCNATHRTRLATGTVSTPVPPNRHDRVEILILRSLSYKPVSSWQLPRVQSQRYNNNGSTKFQVTPVGDGLRFAYTKEHRDVAKPRREVLPNFWLRHIYFGSDGSKNGTSWPPSVSSQDLASNEARTVAQLTDAIRRFGFVFVTGVPFETGEATEKLLEKIAFIRQTHYGGFYDFVPDLAMADTAYTNLALGAHTDTTYFSDPAGLQAFHLLSHSDPTAKDGKGTLGGQSLLVDGFYAASILKAEDPKAFEILSQVKLPWHASGNEGITIAPDKMYPVLEVGDKTGEMDRLRWNNDDRGVVPFDGPFSPTEWYEAARKWHSILTRKDVEYWVQLEPGNLLTANEGLLVFDNWRVLHGRSAFTGVRRMCGGYINRDDFVSRWRNTNFPREEILKRIVG
ncbi:trimethyllysine dioxygenase [Apiospora hydei]|uniref:Trimethyllysine dioxygenase n=1 Tax=Apiospora hydei TaxID=1337664 RepID=A0ABR1V3B1_9PEZI